MVLREWTVAVAAALTFVIYVVSMEKGADLLLATMRNERNEHRQVSVHRERAIVLLTGERLWRVPAAALLQSQTGLPLLVSGRNASHNFDTLRAAGATKLWSEPFSVNTEENAAYSACILAEKRIDSAFIVTDEAHMPRAVAWFRYYGLNVTPAVSGPPWPGRSPNPWLPSKIGWQRSKAVLHEWGGLVDFTVRSFLGHRLACPKPAQSGEP